MAKIHLKTVFSAGNHTDRTRRTSPTAAMTINAIAKPFIFHASPFLTSRCLTARLSIQGTYLGKLYCSGIRSLFSCSHLFSCFFMTAFCFASSFCLRIISLVLLSFGKGSLKSSGSLSHLSIVLLSLLLSVRWTE